MTAAVAPHDAAVLGGLSGTEAARRRAARAGPPRRQKTRRSYASIVRTNVFTVFKLILAVAGAATLAFGEWQDSLFLGVLAANASIGTDFFRLAPPNLAILAPALAGAALAVAALAALDDRFIPGRTTARSAAPAGES